MNTMSFIRVILTGCLSCLLGACIAAGPDEEGSDEPVVVSTEVENMQATAAASEPGGEEMDAVGCNGTGNWCLAKCHQSGSTQHVVGKKGSLNGVCVTPAGAYCQQHDLGYLTHACWGYVNNN